MILIVIFVLGFIGILWGLFAFIGLWASERSAGINLVTHDDDKYIGGCSIGCLSVLAIIIAIYLAYQHILPGF